MHREYTPLEDFRAIDAFVDEQARIIANHVPKLHSLSILGRQRPGYTGWSVWRFLARGPADGDPGTAVVLDKLELELDEKCVACACDARVISHAYRFLLKRSIDMHWL